MKFVVFGLSISSSWGNGHATLWRGLCRALSDLGHDVVFFERELDYYAQHRDLHKLSSGTLVFYETWDGVFPAAKSELSNADEAIVTSYCPDALAATELVLDSRAPLRLFYDLDTPVTLERLAAGEPVAYIGENGLAEFDLVLSYTGGAILDALRTRLGARRVAPLYGSVVPLAHRPVPAAARFAADLSYVGTYAPDRQAALEELFVQPASALPKRKFLLAAPSTRVSPTRRAPRAPLWKTSRTFRTFPRLTPRSSTRHRLSR